MKVGFLLAAVGLAVVFSASCTQKGKELKTDKDKVSYAIGQDIGNTMKTREIDIDPEILGQSIQDVLSGKPSKLTPEEIQKTMQAFQQAQMDKQTQKFAKNKAEGTAFLEKNKAAEGVKVTASGLQYKVISEGKGESPKDDSTVKVHYAGRLIDGTEFDSSIKRGQPAEFPVGGVIRGWTEALKMMKVGDKWQITLPSDLAYGPQGQPPTIPPDSVLIFDVELLEVKKPAGKKGK